jgi:hypothetical protein
MTVGVSLEDWNRLIGDDKVYDLPRGPITADAGCEISGRRAAFGIPDGWAQRTASDMADIRAREADETTVCTQIYPLHVGPDLVYSITVNSAALPSRLLTTKNLLPLVLAVERNMGLRASTRVYGVAFGGMVGWLWHLQGPAEGIRFGRPDQPAIDVHCAELWGPVDADTVVKLLLVAPRASADEATIALSTVISSWRYGAPRPRGPGVEGPAPLR